MTDQTNPPPLKSLTVLNELEQLRRASQVRLDMPGLDLSAVRQSLARDALVYQRMVEQVRLPILAFTESLKAERLLISQATSLFAKQAEDLKNLTRSLYVLPEFPALLRASKFASGIVVPPLNVSGIDAWQETLTAKMARIDTAWADAARIDLSGLAFAKLTQVASTIVDQGPFDDETSEFVEKELGSVVQPIDARETSDAREQRFTEAGRNPVLVAFPRKSYPTVVIAAGFDLEIEMPPIPVAEENTDETATFNTIGSTLFTSLEQHLRKFVSGQFETRFGPEWIRHRVPGQILERWRLRREEAANKGRALYSIIHYSDFMDLENIVTQRNNWTEIFEPYFMNSMHFKVSMQRLHSIRVEIAHSRPIGMSDTLSLVTELTRLMKAMGVSVRQI